MAKLKKGGQAAGCHPAPRPAAVMRNPAEAGPADGESCQVKTSQRQINEPLPGLEAPQQLQRLAASAYINSAAERK